MATARLPALCFCLLVIAWGCGTSRGGFGAGADGGAGSSGGGSGSGGGGSGGGSGGGGSGGSSGGGSGDDGGSLVGDGGSGGSSGGMSAACMGAAGALTNTGCEYYAVDPDVDVGGRGGCFTAYIANTWTSAVTLTVDYAGNSLDASKFAYVATGSGANIQYAPIANASLPAGEVALLFLDDVPGANDGIGSLDCPSGVTTAMTTNAAQEGTGIGSAFHIMSTGPVAAYDIYPYGGGKTALTSATLLLPTTSWGTNYVAVTAFGSGEVLEDLPFIGIVAEQDGTQVTINPTAAIVGGNGVAAGPQGQPTTYSLGAGQLLQIVQNGPLDGSIIQSNNPVGVWGGKSSVAIVSCCDDSAHQQIPPVRALGSEYVGVRYRNRYAGTEEYPPWRIIGAADGTVLTWDPSPPSGAPTTLSLGQVTQFDSNGPFAVSSQDSSHPFYVSAHMTGAAEFDPSQQDGGSNATPDGRGDAEFVNVIPPAEFVSSYVFFTDPTYPETDLVIVQGQGSSGFADVTLDCAGTLTGWQPVGTSGKYQYTRFDLVTGDFQGTGSCNNGRHEMTSSVPFGVTVWGWGSAATGQVGSGFYTQYVSYAYPAGAGVAPINQVIIPPTTQ
jgi:IgGFc binding protein